MFIWDILFRVILFGLVVKMGEFEEILLNESLKWDISLKQFFILGRKYLVFDINLRPISDIVRNLNGLQFIVDPKICQ